MKLFIINQGKFINDFPDGGNSRSLSHREIHRSAFNTLSEAIAEGNIPLVLMPEYKDEGYVIFDFHSFKGDVYFYTYSTTAS
jgi:hypothetical protein